MQPCHVQPECRDVAVPLPWPREGSPPSLSFVDQVAANVEDVKFSGSWPVFSLEVAIVQSEKKNVNLSVAGSRRWWLDRLAHDLVELAEPYSKTQD
jgi:hypothetical protein